MLALEDEFTERLAREYFAQQTKTRALQNREQ
jgi:hypothetical protein